MKSIIYTEGFDRKYQEAVEAIRKIQEKSSLTVAITAWESFNTWIQYPFTLIRNMAEGGDRSIFRVEMDADYAYASFIFRVYIDDRFAYNGSIILHDFEKVNPYWAIHT